MVLQPILCLYPTRKAPGAIQDCAHSDSFEWNSKCEREKRFSCQDKSHNSESPRPSAADDSGVIDERARSEGALAQIRDGLCIRPRTLFNG
jgi:hypothetical protein